MITPTTITNYNRTEEELEEFLMFAILVAGKGAEQQAIKLNAFLKHCMHKENGKPFALLSRLSSMGWLEIQMKEFKLGQYKRIGHAFKEILKFKGRLSKVTIEELESVKGIGSKTARFFILHSRPNQQLAVLDTHILKWLAKATRIGMPKSTPPKSKYKTIESLFLTEASIRNMSPADLDLQIWKEYATKTK
jgi:thermostable 8-oxoguanine DNA glycosylase